MTFDTSQFVTKSTLEQPIIALYSKHGVGKSSMIASARNPFVIDGERKFKCDGKFTAYTPETLEDLVASLDYLLSLDDKFDFGMVGIDTLDATEKLIHEAICKEYSVKSVIDDRAKDLNYTKGYTVAANRFHSDVFSKLNDIKKKYNVPIIITAHAAKTKETPPDNPEFDVWNFRVNKHLADVVSDLCHVKLFMRKVVGYDQNGTMIPSEQRELVVTDDIGISAKNNMFMPKKTLKISYLNAWGDFIAHAKKCYDERPIKQCTK